MYLLNVPTVTVSVMEVFLKYAEGTGGYPQIQLYIKKLTLP